MKSREHGVIDHWNGNSYGFIKPDAGGNDLFFYRDELEEGHQVRRGDKASFDTEQDQFKSGKAKAVRVRLESAGYTTKPGMFGVSDAAPTYGDDA